MKDAMTIQLLAVLYSIPSSCCRKNLVESLNFSKKKGRTKFGYLVWGLSLAFFAAFDLCYEFAVTILMLVRAYDTHSRNLLREVE